MILRRWKSFAPLAIVLALLSSAPAKGQQNGHYLPAATGLTNGSLPPPGLYLGFVPFEYFVDSIKGPNGGSTPANITINAPSALISTGDFSSDQVFNSGLGMWSQFFQLGTTYYPDKFKKWNASILSTWEICGTKLATNIRPGDQMTLEYGLGWRMFNYKLNIGVAGTY